MTLLKKYQILSLVTVLAVTLFFGCESNFKEVQKSNFTEFVPSGEAEKINLKYTDSGRIQVILMSPKMLEYGSVDFPFTEFPKGIDVTLYDKNGKKMPYYIFANRGKVQLGKYQSVDDGEKHKLLYLINFDY